MGDATSLYWMTERLTRVSTVADYVTMGDYGSYQSDYRWDDGELRELIRKGKQLDAKQVLVPFQIHIRFNKDGDAVYQQYRVNGKVLPLQRDQLERYKQEANDVVTSIKKQSRDGQSLIQGYWDGETFETCKGREFTTLEFNQTLPKFVIDRLASVDSYMAFIGKESRNAATVDELLMLNDDDFDCVPRPKLISE
ncbi:peptidyl-prolyl cis-trans isomerase [Vibrio campbellii]|nr:peptidyl-prolyl cis-trans isomerase [Vibrio campbellii]